MSGQLVKTIDVLRDQFVNAPTALKICECPMSFIGGSRPIQRMPSRKDTDFLILGRNLTLKIRKIKRPYPPRECVFPSVGNHHWRDSAPLWALSAVLPSQAEPPSAAGSQFRKKSLDVVLDVLALVRSRTGGPGRLPSRQGFHPARCCPSIIGMNDDCHVLTLSVGCTKERFCNHWGFTLGHADSR